MLRRPVPCWTVRAAHDRRFAAVLTTAIRLMGRGGHAMPLLMNNALLPISLRSLLLTAAALMSSPSFAADAPISEAELAADIRILASDDFEGRGPGTAGETRTIAHIVGTWAAAGLRPLAHSSTPWLQPVPLVETHQLDGSMTFQIGDHRLSLSEQDIALRARAPKVEIIGAPLIFTGYGIDGAGKVTGDVAGKVVLILGGDAPFMADPPSLRTRREMLAQAGAAAVIVVADMSMPWLHLRTAYPAPFTRLDDDKADVAFDAMISLRGFDELMGKLGRKGSSMRDAANAANYWIEALPVAVDIKASADVRRYASHNVIGHLAGGNPDGKSVVVMGHWDHLGVCQPDDKQDKICNGAVDNASGIAVMNAVAKRLTQGARPDRDIYFLATTAEEQGLLGAFHFVDHAPMPLNSITIALNLDTVAIAKRGTPVALIGRGRPAYDAKIASVAAAMGRKMDKDGDADPFIRRQDGWAFGVKNIPALMVGGSFSDMALLEKFLGSDYHRASDELTDAVPLGGAAEDGDLHVALIRAFADRTQWTGDDAGPDVVNVK